MSSSPLPLNPLFDLGQISIVGIAIILIYLAAGLGFFYLSFTTRHGRSRWPLHALMALGIIALGSGLAWGATAGISMIEFLGSLAVSGGENPSRLAAKAARSLVAPFWLGIVGALLGVLAGFRAILGMLREPGPRF